MAGWRAGSVIDQIRHEFELIARLNYAPFFLTVEDIVRFARDQKILHQGRGSAANSAVCYALGITEVDPAQFQPAVRAIYLATRATNRPISMSISSTSGGKRSSNMSTAALAGIAPGYARR